jgi:DNA-binding winged helix-turn-helix (wHTH) protein
MKSLTEHYSNVLTTIMCALLIWFGTQVMETTVELAELRTEVLHLRKDLTDNKQVQQYIHKDFEQRLRVLERYSGKDE